MNYTFLINQNNFKRGDIIKVKSLFTNIVRYPIWHYGVVVGNDDIVHFNLNTDEIDMKIIRTDLKTFIHHGSYLQKCEMSSLHTNFTPDEIARRAISKVGTNFGGYNLFTNNCEHFANWCATGDCYSNQVPTDEGEHTLSQKVAEKVIYEPIAKFCDKGEAFCDAGERFTSTACDNLINFFSLFGL